MVSHRNPFESLSSAECSRLLADNDRLRHQLRDLHRSSDLAGSSHAIQRVGDLIAQVAPATHGVWLSGEDGVGKTRVARAIHARSPRSAGPFVTVSCAALPETAVDAQLFGAEGFPGGGVIGGSLARAAGGTLFLDEIADLGPVAQLRLLVPAREHAWEGPAGVRIPLDVRFIAASSRNIDDLVAAGAFRRDLWASLATVTIPVPPLRERMCDLPVLADLFVEEVAREHVRLVSRVSGRAVDMLMSYDWPGNVSQLRRTVERAVALTTGPVIHHHHLPPEVQDAGGARAALALGLSEALDEYEKELLQDALLHARGVRSQAARMLMTSERVLSYRLRKHGIDSRRYKAS